MMGTLFRLVFLGAVGVVLGWAAFTLVPSVAGGFSGSEESWYRGAFLGNDEGRSGLGPRTVNLPKALGSLMVGAEGTLTRGEGLVLRHLRAAVGYASFFVVFILVSILVGLIVRERLRLGGVYASPTSGFLAKRLVEGVTLAVILWMFSPIPAPYWAFYPLSFVGMAGLSAYVANLPLRL